MGKSDSDETVDSAKTTPDGVPQPPATGSDETRDHVAKDVSGDSQVTGEQPSAHSSEDVATRGELPAHRPRAGQGKLPSIEGYEILSVLGRGGMGVVYKARQKGLNRLVALKMILAGDHASQADVERFRTEAEAVARLQHHHIVQIHEIGEADGYPYFSLEFVDGDSLSKVLAGSPQPPRDAASMIMILAEAMQYAHGQGIVHRDLKPANILLSREAEPATGSSASLSSSLSMRSGSVSSSTLGIPKIADFGLAKHLDDNSGMTKSGTILGTPSYMAPEQSFGEIHKIGPLVDVYSLGAILYEMLTGCPPFRGSTVLDTLEMVRFQEPVPPSRLQPKIPPDLENICLMCLHKEPSKRYASAGELSEDLGRFLRGETVRARPVSHLDRLRRWCLRNKGTTFLLCVIAFSLIGGTVLSTYFALRAGRGEREAIEQARIATERKEESDRRRYVAEFRWGLQKWKDGRINEVRDILHALEPAEPNEPDLRHFEWHYLERLCHLELRTIQGHTAPIYRVISSPNGRAIATAGIDKTVRIWERATGQLLHTLTGHTGPVLSVAFSSDGRLLASAGVDKVIKIWDADSGQERATLIGHEAAVRSLAFHPTLHALASGSADNSIRFWDLKTKQSTLLTGHAGSIQALAFSPQTHALYSASADGRILVWDCGTGQAKSQFAKLPAPLQNFSLSGDGLYLAATGSDRQTHVWRTGTGEQSAILPMADLPNSIALSPNGDSLAAAHNDGMVHVWQVANGRENLVLRGHSGPVMGVNYSEDGWQLLTAGADQTLKVWDAASTNEKISFRGHSSAIFAVAVSPDDRRAVTAGFDGILRIWDVQTGIEIQKLRGHQGEVLGLSFLGDSHKLVSVGKDGTARIWETQSGKALEQFERAHERLSCCSSSPDGKWLAAGGESGTIIIWDLDTHGIVKRLNHHRERIASVVFHPGGRLIGSVSNDHSTRVVDLESGETRFLLQEEENSSECLAFTPDGRYVIAGTDLRFWNLETGEKLFALQSNRLPQFSVVVSADGRRVIATGPDMLVRVWDIATKLELLILSPPLESPDQPGAIDRGLAVALGKRGECLVSVHESGLIQIWNAAALSPGEHELREAASLVRFLMARHSKREDILRFVREQAGISEAVRNRALELTKSLCVVTTIAR